jgi:flagellin-like protein
MQNRKTNSRRAVSPIIATILLVAITVVLAAVLYILVTGLIGGSHSVTSSIGVSVTSETTCLATTPAVNQNAYVMTVGQTTATVTTANFGMTITASGSSVPTAPLAPTAATAGDTCPAVAAGNGCVANASPGWIAVLSTASGAVQAYYGTGGTSGWFSTAAGCATALGSAVTVSSGMTITVLSEASLSSNTLTFFGNGGASITGTASF